MFRGILVKNMRSKHQEACKTFFDEAVCIIILQKSPTGKFKNRHFLPLDFIVVVVTVVEIELSRINFH